MHNSMQNTLTILKNVIHHRQRWQALRGHLRTHKAMMCLHNCISYFIYFTDRFHGKSYNIM